MEVTEEKDHVVVTLDDGCSFHMAGKDPGWVIDFPGGFAVTCPHGQQWSAVAKSHSDDLIV